MFFLLLDVGYCWAPPNVREWFICLGTTLVALEMTKRDKTELKKIGKNKENDDRENSIFLPKFHQQVDSASFVIRLN